MREKTDDHESVQGPGSVSSRVSAISVNLGVVSLGMLGLSGLLVLCFGPGPWLIALIMQIGADVMSIVGLIFGIIGLQSKYIERSRAYIGIILCAVSVIIGIATLLFVFGGGLGR